MDPAGVLSIHYDGHVEHVAVSKSMGKTISLPGGKASVEVAEYIPNAQPDANGRFVSRGSQPNNPVLELRVHLPGQKEAIREIAFAHFPLLSLEGIHSRSCPVKFWYHHPAVKPAAGVELLATPDGKLYCRVASEGKCQPRGEVHAGDRIETWGNSSLSLVQFLPHALREVSFVPAETAEEEGESPEAAAQVEITAGGTTRQLWLARGEEGQMPQVVDTKQGRLGITFGYDTLPLGFSLRLAKFTHGLNPGGMGDESFASTVQVLDEWHDVVGEADISMNSPLVHGKFTFYQSGVLPGDRGTVLTVAYDPGRFMKYLGSLMICLGCCWMFFKPANFFQRRAASPNPLASGRSPL